MSKIYWNNSYWMSYIKFEQRVIELSHIISFDDKQMSVYSNEIADLILSVMSKVESVLKDIYERNIYPFEFDNQITEQYSDSYFFREKVESKKELNGHSTLSLVMMIIVIVLTVIYLLADKDIWHFPIISILIIISIFA